MDDRHLVELAPSRQQVLSSCGRSGNNQEAVADAVPICSGGTLALPRLNVAATDMRAYESPRAVWDVSCRVALTQRNSVIPAQAGTHAVGAAHPALGIRRRRGSGFGRADGILRRVLAAEVAWVPACAGMTEGWGKAIGV